jgi:branched-chain amino acid transport system permease protein
VLFQTLLIGLAQGGVYSLSAVGLVLIFSVAGIANLAHGEVVMLGGFIGYETATYWHWPFGVELVAGIIGGAVLGLVVGLVFDRLAGSVPESYLIASLALIFISEGISTSEFGDNAVSIPNAPQSVHTIFGARLPVTWIAIIVVAVVLSVGLSLFVARTSAGRVMRAIALNPVAARIMGVDIRRYALLAFIIGSAFAGLSGVLLAAAFPITTLSGENIAFYSFIVIIFAGLGSIMGALLGGFLLGIVGSVTATYVSSGYADTFIFAFLLIVLLVKPDGLFGVSIDRD